MENTEINFEELQEKLEEEMMWTEINEESNWDFTEEQYENWMNSF